MASRKTSILTIANQKGGVGKTTCTVNLASAFATTGKRVLVVDLDKQANATSHLGAIEAARDDNKYVYDAIVSESTKLEDYVLKTSFKNIDCLAADKRLERINARFLGKPNQSRLLHELFSSRTLSKYDLVLIDTSPNFDSLPQSALSISTDYIIPVFPESHCLEGLGSQFASVNGVVKHQNRKLRFLGCAIIRYDKKISTHKQYEHLFREMAGDSSFSVLTTVIPHSAITSAAASEQKPFHFFRPKSAVTLAYLKLAEEISSLLSKKRSAKDSLPKESDHIETNKAPGLFDLEEIIF